MLAFRYASINSVTFFPSFYLKSIIACFAFLSFSTLSSASFSLATYSRTSFSCWRSFMAADSLPFSTFWAAICSFSLYSDSNSSYSISCCWRSSFWTRCSEVKFFYRDREFLSYLIINSWFFVLEVRFSMMLLSIAVVLVELSRLAIHSSTT